MDNSEIAHALIEYTAWVQKFYPPQGFRQRLEILKLNFTYLWYVHSYTKLQNFIQLSNYVKALPY